MRLRINKLYLTTSYYGLSVYAVGGYEPSLLADFIGDEFYLDYSRSSFNNIFTHSRLGNATMTDSDGLLKWAPHNLLTYSEDLSNSKNSRVDISGTLMEQYVSDTNAGYVGPTNLSYASGQYTFVVEAKSQSLDWIRVQLTTSSTSKTVWFDVSKGVVGTENSAVGSISVLDDGYFRCVVVVDNPSQFALVYLSDADNVSTASSGSGVYIRRRWLYRSDLGGMAPVPVDARVAGSTTYVPTTSTAKYLPRRHNHKYNGAAWVDAGTLIEAKARTNLNLYSEYLSNWSIGAGDSLTLTSGQGVGPDGNSSLYELAITDTTNENKTIYRSHAVTTNETYNISAFFKDVDQRYVLIRSYRSTNNWSTVVFDLQSGEVTQQSNGSGSGTISFASIEDCGEGLLRASFGSSQAGTTLFVAIDFSNSATPTLDAANGYVRYVGTPGVGLYAGFIQLEAASTPSSYIPTSGSTVTRAADSPLTVAGADVPWPTPTVIGDELVTNGGFDTDSDWTKHAGWTISGGIASCDGTQSTTSYFFQECLTVGKLVRVTVNVTDITSGTARAQLGNAYPSKNLVLGENEIVGVVSGNANLIFIALVGSQYSIDNVSVKEINPLAVCIQMEGDMTYADEDAFRQVSLAYWGNPSVDGIEQRITTSTGGTGGFQAVQSYSSVGDSVSSVGTYSPGINVPFNIASRHGSTFINGAVDGTALTADLTPVALPDLSSTDLQIAYDFMGNVKQVRVWAVDIGDTGIAEASA